MKLPYPDNRGFTLIELMIVVAILGIISGITIPTFSKFTKNQSLKQAQETFKSDVRSIQNKALTGAGSDSFDDIGNEIVGWGFVTSPSTSSYEVFMTSNATSTGCTASNTAFINRVEVETLTLPTGAVFEATRRCIIFRMSDGNASSLSLGGNQTVTLQSTTSIDTKAVRVSGTGLIRNL